MRHRIDAQWLRRCHLFAGLALVLGPTACAPSVGQDQADAQFMVARFNPTAGVVPIPNDLATSGGHLNLPVAADAGTVETIIIGLLNELDGWATNPVLQTTVLPHPKAEGLILDTSTIPAGVLMLDTVTLQPVPVAGQWNPTTGMMSVVPRVLLDSDRRYAVIITSALKDSAGGAVTEDTVFDFIRKREPLLREDGTARFSIPISDAQVEAFRNDPANSLVVGRLNTEQVRTLLRNGAAGQLDQLRRAYAPLFAAYESLFSQPREDVKLLWTFETQSTVGRLKGKRDEVRANTLRIPSNVNVDADNDGLILIPAAAHPATAQLPDSSAIGGVIEGTFDTLHFVATFPATAEASCTGVEEAGTRGLSNPFQAAPTCFRLPFTLIVPAAPGPHGVALVGHALTSSRHSLVAVANTLARLNLATVAIDFFDHGARTIDATAGPGASFVGIDLAGSRDGMLQSVLDMARLIDVLQTTDWATLLGAGHALAATEVRYVGCGLGAGFGAMLAAVEPSVSALVLNTPPAGWGKTLTESTDIGPRIRELAGTLGATTPEDVQELVVIADWLLGSSDPINYGRALRGRPVFVQTAATDTVFPSAQQDALAAEIFPGLDLPTVANYRRAETSAHCYLFDAANGGQHTVDAQTQMATFLAAPSAVGGN